MLPALPAALGVMLLAPGAATARPVYEAPASRHCEPAVCVHWVESGEDAVATEDVSGNGVPDLVDQVAAEVRRTRARQTGPAPEGLGWREPLSDGDRGGSPGGETDVYLGALGGSLGAAPTDQDTCRASADTGARVCAGHILLERSLRGEALRDVVAHELNHLVVYAYTAGSAPWLLEATATWMTSVVEPEGRTWLRFVERWAQETEQSMASVDPRKMYGVAVWLQWLAGRYGATVVRELWEATPPSDTAGGYFDGPMPVLDAVIARHGGGGFVEQFSRFAAALPEWQAPGSGFATGALFPDVERVGVLPAGAPPVAVDLAFAAFGVFDVPVPAGGTLRLTGRFGDGEAGAVALVGRPEGAVAPAVSAVDVQAGGGQASVALGGVDRFSRISAVVVNPQLAAKPGTSVSRSTVAVTHERDLAPPHETMAPPPGPAPSAQRTDVGPAAPAGPCLPAAAGPALPGRSVLTLRAPRRVTSRALARGLTVTLDADRDVRLRLSVAPSVATRRQLRAVARPRGTLATALTTVVCRRSAKRLRVSGNRRLRRALRALGRTHRDARLVLRAHGRSADGRTVSARVVVVVDLRR